MGTEVSELSYTCDPERYDRDITGAIPGYAELHKRVEALLKQEFDNREVTVLELGVGTGRTTRSVLRALPAARYTAVDFSEHMLARARTKLEGKRVSFVLGDYSTIPFPQGVDVIVSVIGIHHQETDREKKALFRKIYSSLSSGGVFVFGDLVTYRDLHKVAVADARHYHHMVEHLHRRSLREWAHHHRYLNRPAALEDQLSWLKDCGFKEVRVVFRRFNTILVVAKR